MTGDVGRPFVDVPMGDVDIARRLAGEVADRLGLGEPRLVRLGMNAVFETADAVIRVGRPTADGREAIGLAERLEAIGVRVPRPLVDAEQYDAATADGGAPVVSVWERLIPSHAPIEWDVVGAMVARLHRHADERTVGGYPCPPPTAFPWWDFDALLGSVRGVIDDASAMGLAATVARHRRWADVARADTVVCHGDVHPGNVVQTADGPVLLDWDLLCRAPAGWDHGPMMTWAERWGGAPGEYEAFAAGYGRSMREDPFAVAVAELRLVAATLMRVRAGIGDPVARAEADVRLRYWRGETDAPAWSAQ